MSYLEKLERLNKNEYSPEQEDLILDLEYISKDIDSILKKVNSKKLLITPNIERKIAEIKNNIKELDYLLK